MLRRHLSLSASSWYSSSGGPAVESEHSIQTILFVEGRSFLFEPALPQRVLQFTQNNAAYVIEQRDSVHYYEDMIVWLRGSLNSLSCRQHPSLCWSTIDQQHSYSVCILTKITVGPLYNHNTFLPERNLMMKLR